MDSEGYQYDERCSSVYCGHLDINTFLDTYFSEKVKAQVEAMITKVHLFLDNFMNIKYSEILNTFKVSRENVTQICQTILQFVESNKILNRILQQVFNKISAVSEENDITIRDLIYLQPLEVLGVQIIGDDGGFIYTFVLEIITKAKNWFDGITKGPQLTLLSTISKGVEGLDLDFNIDFSQIKDMFTNFTTKIDETLKKLEQSIDASSFTQVVSDVMSKDVQSIINICQTVVNQTNKETANIPIVQKVAEMMGIKEEKMEAITETVTLVEETGSLKPDTVDNLVEQLSVEDEEPEEEPQQPDQPKRDPDTPTPSSSTKNNKNKSNGSSTYLVVGCVVGIVVIIAIVVIIIVMKGNKSHKKSRKNRSKTKRRKQHEAFEDDIDMV